MLLLCIEHERFNVVWRTTSQWHACEGINPITKSVDSTTWAVLYRVFFSREIYAVDDNELVIP